MTLDDRRKVYDRYAALWGTCAGARRSGDAEVRSPQLTRMISRHFPKQRDAAILDLGCGDGAVIQAAQQLSYSNVVGVDISPTQVAAAKQSGLTTVTQADLQEHLATIDDASLDLVIAFDVIEHLERPELFAVADEVFRVLKPGGRWLIHTCNAASPFFGAVRYGDITHELAFTSGSIAQLLFASGFTAVRCSEDEPTIHGARSAARWVLWKAVSVLLAAYWIAETGDRGSRLLTRNLYAVASK